MLRGLVAFRHGRVEPLQDAELQKTTQSVSCSAQLRNVFRPTYVRPTCVDLTCSTHAYIHIHVIMPNPII